MTADLSLNWGGNGFIYLLFLYEKNVNLTTLYINLLMHKIPTTGPNIQFVK